MFHFEFSRIYKGFFPSDLLIFSCTSKFFQLNSKSQGKHLSIHIERCFCSVTSCFSSPCNFYPPLSKSQFLFQILLAVARFYH